MAEKKQKLNLGDFYCTVSSNGQIFMPVRMREVLGIVPNDEVKFSLKDDGKILFSKDEETSKQNHGQKNKDASDAQKSRETLS